MLGGPVRKSEAGLPMVAKYLRVVALLLLAAGLARAGLILGINPSGTTFTDLPPPWRAGATTLVVLDLFAAVGLWVGAAWGPVMWSVAVLVEIAMYTWFADQFGSYPLRIAGHLALFGGYLALAAVKWRDDTQ